MVKRSSLVILAALALAKGHVAYWNTPNKLQPVHGLYVKPSADGTTGDLYVAASEDNGVKSQQWLTDQPVGFLPTTPAHQALPALPGYTPNLALTDDTINNQKRAVLSPPLQYAYAYPVPGNTEGNSVIPYPYNLPTSNPTQANTEAPLSPEAAVTTGMPQYHPFQYFYPQMMSAYADLLNTFREKASALATAVGANEESTTAASPQTPSMWPYTYPMQYVMVDPNMWAQSQAAAISATTTTTTDATVDKE